MLVVQAEALKARHEATAGRIEEGCRHLFNRISFLFSNLDRENGNFKVGRGFPIAGLKL